MPLEEVLNRTFSFWNNNKGNVVSKVSSNNKLLHSLTVKRDMSLGSYGETYIIKIGYDPDDSMTYISAEVSLSFGYGLQWLTPQKLLKQWAQSIGVVPMKLIRKQDPNFINRLNHVMNISNFSSNISQKKFCPYCGKENQIGNNYCKNCGANIENL
ncbi:MAG: zinc ribbon domain-containing protein [Promethearchaeota archaeon]